MESMEDEKNDVRVKDFFMKRWVDIVLLFAGLFLGIYFDWTVIEMLIFLIFLWSLLGPIASRILAVPALFFLFLTPLLLFFKRPERAEEFAVYAYYFLVMAVIRAAIEVRNEGEKKDTPQSI